MSPQCQRMSRPFTQFFFDDLWIKSAVPDVTHLQIWTFSLTNPTVKYPFLPGTVLYRLYYRRPMAARCVNHKPSTRTRRAARGCCYYSPSPPRCFDCIRWWIWSPKWSPALQRHKPLAQHCGSVMRILFFFFFLFSLPCSNKHVFPLSLSALSGVCATTIKQNQP